MGSEMCIRDRNIAGESLKHGQLRLGLKRLYERLRRHMSRIGEYVGVNTVHPLTSL